MHSFVTWVMMLKSASICAAEVFCGNLFQELVEEQTEDILSFQHANETHSTLLRKGVNES